MIRNLLFFLFSLFFIVSCKKQSETNPNITKADRLYEEGILLLEKNDVKAYLKFQEAISYYSKENDFSDISKSLILQANAQKNRGDFLGAESTLVEALKMMKENDESLYALYDTMANLKLNQNQYSQAIEWYDKALSVKIESEEKRLSILNNKSVAEYKLGRYKQALDILQKLDLSKLSDLNLKNRIKDNIEYIKWLDSNNAEAQVNIENILKLKLENNDFWGANSSYAHLAEINKKSDPEKSLYYAKKMLEIAQINKSPGDRLEAIERIIYVDKPANTNKYFQIYKSLSDSIQSSRNDYTNKFAFIKYENTKVKAEKAEKENQLLWLSLASALLIVILIVIFLYQKRQKRLQQEKEIEVKNTQLKMSKKVHDVVANGLYHMMIDVQNNPEMDKTRILNDIEKMYEESRDISHENIAEKDFALRFINMITSYSSDEQKVLPVGYKENIWENISYNTQLELYYILREILVNMRKHSQAKLASVRFEKDHDKLKIRYTDNGIGINDVDQQKGTGIHNTENRIESIGGDITFEKNPTGGLIIRITIPIQSKYV
jgi:tetratricopeptide (TPR) repeat protein